MELYAVIRYGINMQGLFGIFKTKSKAFNHAMVQIINEPDSYHEFQVQAIDLDEPYCEETRIQQDIDVIYKLTRTTSGHRITVRHASKTQPKFTKNTLLWMGEKGNREIVFEKAAPYRNTHEKAK